MRVVAGVPVLGSDERGGRWRRRGSVARTQRLAPDVLVYQRQGRAPVVLQPAVQPHLVVAGGLRLDPEGAVQRAGRIPEVAAGAPGGGRRAPRPTRWPAAPR